MRQSLIRYRTKPGTGDENARLVADVFKELHETQPDGVRYLVLRVDDAFFHLVFDPAPQGDATVPKTKAFKVFQSGVKERAVEPAQSGEVTVVGNYRMLGD